MNHDRNCNCDECIRIAAGIAKLITGFPVARRQQLCDRGLRLSVPSTVLCPACGGSGVRPMGDLRTMTCPPCGGLGRVPGSTVSQ